MDVNEASSGCLATLFCSKLYSEEADRVFDIERFEALNPKLGMVFGQPAL
jgi:hypothetical protein